MVSDYEVADAVRRASPRLRKLSPVGFPQKRRRKPSTLHPSTVDEVGLFYTKFLILMILSI